MTHIQDKRPNSLVTEGQPRLLQDIPDLLSKQIKIFFLSRIKAEKYNSKIIYIAERRMLNKNVLKNVYIYAWYIAPHNKTGLRVLPLSALSPKKRTLEKK